MIRATIRYWAAAKEAAGTAEEPCTGPTLADALARVRATHADNDRLLRVLDRSSFIVDEEPVGTRPHDGVELAQGSVVEVLPPFAGG
ncbi:molybdopterin converting factor small subunit [Haloactinospora alba]|uniref:Molybdopterin converting factor small subunit n=1 Tax=Haloactinospora alba TaxID=405555 RepID=A0A543N6W3_9ACTN|nr:MoaD/ThiS family protein [Haloactinospora alba]TQN27547.1 molybdopterin converting factor small subunit [Haloactinospora alba]